MTTLAAQSLDKAKEQVFYDENRRRRGEAEKRVAIMRRDWRYLVREYMRPLYRSTRVHQAVAARIKRNMNLLSALCSVGCVAYRREPTRTLVGASEATQKAFKQLVGETMMAVRAKEVERMSWAANVAVTVPVVRPDYTGKGKRMSVDILLPNHTDVLLPSRDPDGKPLVSLSSYREGPNVPGAPTTFVALDKEKWTYFSEDGAKKDIVEHGAGVYPGAVWRHRDSLGEFWDTDRGGGVVDASVEVAHLAARMDWVRFGQDRMQKVLYHGNKVQIPAQDVDPDGALKIPARKNESTFEVLNSETSTLGARDHIVFHAREGARSMDIPPDLIDMSVGPDVAAAAGTQVVLHSMVMSIRQNAIDFHHHAERDFWWRVALVAKGMGHPLAGQVPADQVRESFSIDYADLDLAEDTLTILAAIKEQLNLGLMSTVGAYQRMRPGTTPAEAKAAVERVAEEESELNEIYVQRNTPRNRDVRFQNVAELQGKLGGFTKAQNNDDESEEDDDAE